MTQTIRRAARRHRFVIVDQAAVEDTRLSWAARGLLAYLLSRPDDWKVLVNDLRKRGNLGRDGIYALLRELRATDYVSFQRRRDAKGRMRGGTYTVSEVPSPRPDSPHVANPDAAAPRAAKPGALPKTDIRKKPTTTTRPTSTYPDAKPVQVVSELILPDWVPPELNTGARRIIAELDAAAAEVVVDEWIGAMAAGAILSSPLGYLRALVQSYRAGDMTLRYASGEPHSKF